MLSGRVNWNCCDLEFIGDAACSYISCDGFGLWQGYEIACHDFTVSRQLTDSVGGVFEPSHVSNFYGEQGRRWLRSSLRQNGFVIGEVPLRGGLGFKY